MDSHGSSLRVLFISGKISPNLGAILSKIFTRTFHVRWGELVNRKNREPRPVPAGFY